MDRSITTVMQTCTGSSDAEQASFPDIIGQLMGVGVERYHADLWRGVLAKERDVQRLIFEEVNDHALVERLFPIVVAQDY